LVYLPGFAEDVERMGRREVDVFFRKYYGPSNLTAAVVGDVNPEKVIQLIQKGCRTEISSNLSVGHTGLSLLRGHAACLEQQLDKILTILAEQSVILHAGSAAS
jgi:hypothetical protein